MIISLYYANKNYSAILLLLNANVYFISYEIQNENI